MRTVAWGLSLQIIFAFLVLRFSFGQQAMAWAGDVVNSMLACTQAGTKVLFGALGTQNTSLGSIFAFRCCRPSSLSPRFSRCSITLA